LLGIAGTGIELQKIDHSPEGQEAQAKDANGDVVASTVYGLWERVTHTYKVHNGTTVTAGDLGSVAGTLYYLTKFKADRSNDNTLTITAEGVLSSLFAAAPQLYAINALFPAGYLTGGRGALAAGITVSAGAVISGSVEASATLMDPLLSAAGAVVDLDLFAGRMTATNECQAATGVPAATAAASWQLEPGSGSQSDDNASYGTKTFTAFRNITATP
jgi:hypothetical protein